MEAVQHVPMEDREAFKYALAATLVKNHAHWKAFETVFEVYFSLRRPGPGDDSDLAAELDAANLKPDESGAAGGGSMDSLSPEELAEMLYRALLNADEATMRALARQAVTRFAGMEPGRPVGGTYYLYRTLRNLDLDGVLERLMEASREEAGGELTTLEERLEHDEYQERIARLRPLHAPVRVRHQQPVLTRARLRVHRRHRRGHEVLRGHRRRQPGSASREHRSRRHLGRRALRLRPRLRCVLGQVGVGDLAQELGDPPRRRPQQLPLVAGVDREGAAPAGPARLLAQPRAAELL